MARAFNSGPVEVTTVSVPSYTSSRVHNYVAPRTTMFLRARPIALRPRHRAIISSSRLNRRSLADQQTPFPTYFQPPPSPPPYKPRYFRGGLYAIVSFGLCYGLIAITPWAISGMGRTSAEPGSREDSVWQEMLSKQLDNLPIVKDLRSEPQWQEWQAYSSFNDEEKKHRLTSGPMGGVRGVAMQVCQYARGLSGCC
jgi:hypothetical protein